MLLSISFHTCSGLKYITILDMNTILEIGHKNKETGVGRWLQL